MWAWQARQGGNSELLHEFQRLIALRHQRASLRRGGYQVAYAKENLFVHVRDLGDDIVVCGFNAGTSTGRVDVPVDRWLSDGSMLEQAWGHDARKVEMGMLHGLELPPRSGRVWMTPLANRG